MHKKTIIGGLVVAMAVLVAPGVGFAGWTWTYSSDSGTSHKAVVELESRSGSTVTGKATFTERDGKVRMKVAVKGLTPGLHAIHLHDTGDCSAPDASSAGGTGILLRRTMASGGTAHSTTATSATCLPTPRGRPR